MVYLLLTLQSQCQDILPQPHFLYFLQHVELEQSSKQYFRVQFVKDICQTSQKNKKKIDSPKI